MPTLTVWRFPTQFGADEGELRLKILRDKGAAVVHDAVTVVWPPEKDRPEARRPRHLRASGAGSGALWGGLLGMVFLGPVAGAVIGAGVGRIRTEVTSPGIDDHFVRQLRERLTPGTSALFALTSDVDLDEVLHTFPQGDGELLFTDLSDEAAEHLRDLMRRRDR